MLDGIGKIGYRKITLLGRSQAVRQRTLTPSFAGSSPAAPATSKAKSLKTNELGFFVLWNLLALLIDLLINTLWISQVTMSLYSRGTSYYAVLNVPTAFRSLVGKRQLWVSLRTKNKQIAQRKEAVSRTARQCTRTLFRWYFQVVRSFFRQLEQRDQSQSG